jgi:sulfotransferase family protein
MRLPDFLVIGPPRCGTTWLAKALRSHPEVFMPARKELHFFDATYEGGIESYSAHFRAADASQQVGEATASYLHESGVADRIKETLPDVKMIVVLRDPVDRLVSRYLNIRSAHFETNRDLDVFQKIEAKPEIVQEGLYHTHLSTYYGLFDASQIFVGMFSRIRDEPEAFLSDVYDFLGLSDGHKPTVINSKVNSALSKPNVGKSAGVYFAAVAARRLKLQSLSDRLMSANASGEPVVTDAERERIHELYFREELESLQTEYGITVPR